MNDFIDFLKNNKLYWITPILIFAALMIYLALKSAETPSSPFDYRPY